MRQFGVLNRGGIPLLPGNHNRQGTSAALSGPMLGPDNDYVDAVYGKAPWRGGGGQQQRGIPAGYGQPARQPAAPDPMDPASSNFDPSARTRTQSSYNFRQSVLNNNALAKAKTAAAAEQRAGQRAQAGIQGPAELQAAAGMPGMTPGMPMQAAPAAVAAPTAGGAAPAQQQQQQASAPAGVTSGAIPNPYVGNQGPGTTVPSYPLTQQGAASVGENAPHGTIARSGLPLQAYADRAHAMDGGGPGRIHAVLPADMAQNLVANSLGRDDQRVTPINGGEAVVNRYVAPGIPAGYGPVQQAQDMATARYSEAQAAGQNALAGNPDPLDREMQGAQVGAVNAQTDAVASGAYQAVGDNQTLRKENDRLGNQVRLYQQGGAANDKNQRRVAASAVIAGMKSRDPNVRAASEKQLLQMMSGEDGSDSGGGASATPGAAPSPASGTSTPTATGPDGKKYTVQNGQWVPIQ